MDIVPAPVHIESGEGDFVWPEYAEVSAHKDCLDLAEYLTQELKKRTTLNCCVTASNNETATVQLRIHKFSDPIECPCPDEAYELSVLAERGSILISAEARSGVFYGIQTLLQLLPWTKRLQSPPRIACCRIVDFPRFSWRGTLLDTGRHIFSVSFIKKLLDLMALHKLNKFHWHLTEDQGWRIEIKAFPLLTEVGAYRGQSRYGGFYTQDEIRDIVKYAKDRFIDVIPEIEMPGHCMAALACYPNLSCTGEVECVPVQWGVQSDVYCAGNDNTFTFLETVLDEVMELFPAKYIHIGGDECPKTRWAACPACQQRMKDESLSSEDQLQTYFINRVAAHLHKAGRCIIGWDEIVEGGIPSEAIVMCWRGTVGGIIAAKHKHKVIMTPNTRCYFDYRQSASMQEPGTWYAVLPLEWVYMFDPCCRDGQLDMRLKEDTAEDSPQASALESHTHAQDIQPEKAEQSDAPAHSNPSSLSEMEAVCEGLSAPLQSASATLPTCGGQDSSHLTVTSPAEDRNTESEGLCAMHVEVSTGNASDTDAGPGEAEVWHCTVAQQATFAQHHHGMNADDQQYVIGGQANLWTEFISDEVTAEYMLLPRLCALSECVWSPISNRNWRSFIERTQSLLTKLQFAGYTYRPLAQAEPPTCKPSASEHTPVPLPATPPPDANKA